MKSFQKQIIFSLFCVLIAISVPVQSNSINWNSSRQYISNKNELPKPVAVPKWLENSVHLISSKSHDPRPMISIIIDDMGVNKKWSRKAERLPAPMTLAYLPYADNLRKWTKYAKNQGHELMVHMPMEALRSTVNYGPNPLLTTDSHTKLKSNLLHNLSQFDDYIGINNHMGSKMSQDPVSLALIMQELKKRGLLYIDSRTTALSIGEKMASKFDLPTTHRDVFLDHEETTEFITKSLRKLERKALKHGTAIAIGHPKKLTITTLEKWIPDARARGFLIVPVSEIVKQRMYDKNHPPRLVSAKK